MKPTPESRPLFASIRVHSRFLLGMLACLAMQPQMTQAADSLQLIPFQGRLTNQAGVPYTSGTYDIVFRMYPEAVGSTAIWTERHEKVGVINGTINVFLGSITSLDTVDFSQTRHLGITVDSDNNPNTADPEMVPRQMIIPSFWAKNSEKLDNYDWNSPPDGLFVPIGSVIMWWGAKLNIPAGFELCDGGAVATPGAVLTITKPNLVDKFVKGAGAGAVNVAAANTTGGAHTLDLTHNHNIPDHQHNVQHDHGSGTIVAKLCPPAWNSAGKLNYEPYAQSPYSTSRQIGTTLSDNATSNSSNSAGIETAGRTAGSSITNSGNVVGTLTTSNGALSTVDNRPAFLELFYIIRVK